MVDDVPTTADGGLGRTLSTSSRITIPRSQSPYNGPTAPSHPYTMYPQMTRASSVASESTLRPGSETPFVPHAGPQHPYQLYPQNTVPEEDDDITTNGIPLGFPRTNFQSSNGRSNSDVGDIIGSDGHIEQLPPYSRYADNTVAKGNMDDIVARRRSMRSMRSIRSMRSLRPALAPSHSSQPTTQTTTPSVATSTTLLQPTAQFEEETEAQRARKEGYRPGWGEQLRKPTIAGMPLWGLIVITLMIIFSATIGGVVGGIIGNKQGAQRALANGVVITKWVDAMPTTLGPGASPLPTGHYQIPFNQSQEVSNCIPDTDGLGAAWGCMDIAYIGVNVFEDYASGGMQAAFEDFSVNTADFRYGPQPPDFNGTAFALQPMVDKDASDLGAAMFFSVLFDKLSIVPDYALQVNNEKRAVDAQQFSRRTPAPYDGEPLKPAEQPWFCFWNSTINEFFIYLNEDAPDEPSATTSTQAKYAKHTTSMRSSPTTTQNTYHSTTSGVALQELTVITGTTSPSPTATTFQAYNPTPPGLSASATPTYGVKRRSYESSASNISNYPKLIKMVEKRKPLDENALHVEPYCQKMQVLDNWEIVPIPTVETICIEELQYPTSTSIGTNKRRGKRADDGEGRDVISDLESYCICEWTSQ